MKEEYSYFSFFIRTCLASSFADGFIIFWLNPIFAAHLQLWVLQLKSLPVPALKNLPKKFVRVMVASLAKSISKNLVMAKYSPFSWRASGVILFFWCKALTRRQII